MTSSLRREYAAWQKVLNEFCHPDILREYSQFENDTSRMKFLDCMRGWYDLFFKVAAQINTSFKPSAVGCLKEVSVPTQPSFTTFLLQVQLYLRSRLIKLDVFSNFESSIHSCSSMCVFNLLLQKFNDLQRFRLQKKNVHGMDDICYLFNNSPEAF